MLARSVNYEKSFLRMKVVECRLDFCSIPGMRSSRPQKTGRVKVYRFRLYDVAGESFKIFNRMATPACIRRIRGEIIKRTELEIDKQYVNSDGMTEIGFVDAEACRTYLTSHPGPASQQTADRRTVTAN
jgi:hypothetical protein